MFRKVLVANRGAIAVRIFRTLRRMGVGSVAVYSEADRQSLHVERADESVLIGPPAPSQSYLSIEALLRAAQSTGAEAIHPGYGFLSENADFAEACERSGIVFIGPTPEQMRDFGLKHTARQIASETGVPVLPGTPLLHSLDEAAQAAEQIGYPVMLKSTAGGGGIGMRLCEQGGELADAYTAVERLSRASFGTSGLYLEKFVARARHIEVQIFGDGAGKVDALGERDCSTQRRNQKVIEETPAPGLDDAVRTRLLHAAVRLGEAVRYRSAGTVEFIYDADTAQFYFLEVNTRLQVEHGVTEEVTGIDLVEWMVKLAAGEPLPLTAPTPRGASLQVRIYAEDPARNFQPGAGKLSHVQWPGAARVETWVESGSDVTPFYDPMLAKIIVSGASRPEALNKMRAALAECRVSGIETNLEYLRQVCRHPEFEAGGITTSFLRGFDYRPHTLEVVEPGTQTTIQDYPGRIGYWHVGVPPSGPMDALSFRVANRLLGNPEDAPGLEIAVTGPTLRFHRYTAIALSGADFQARLNGLPLPPGHVVEVKAGSLLEMATVRGAGSRAYLAVAGGFDVPSYLGSRSTFILGKFGGHAGRPLRPGDILHLRPGLPLSGPPASGLRVSGPPLPDLPPSGPPLSDLPPSGLPPSGLPLSGLPPSGLPLSGLPLSGPPLSGPPLSGPPLSGPPLSGPPLSGLPLSGPPLSGLLLSGLTLSDLPFSGPPLSGPPLSGPPLSGPPLPGPPFSGPPLSAPPLPAPPLSGPPLPDPPLSGLPLSGPPLSGPPLSGPPPSDLPPSDLPPSGPPLSGLPLAGPPLPHLPPSGPPLSGLPPSDLFDPSGRCGANTPVCRVETHLDAFRASTDSAPVWEIGVLYGPHGAPDFFTPEDIETFFSTSWKVHHNSDRTGVRLIGPKPVWARKDGGEAGLHPSNIHDNAYAIGTIDFTGDMPVILGPDGPSLGGFVCPATIVQAELWKTGQLKPGDLVRFRAISLAQARAMEDALDRFIDTLQGDPPTLPAAPVREDPILRTAPVCRADGDRYLLVEYGPNVLDLNLRIRVHALESQLRGAQLRGILDITPGVRSLHIHYDARFLSREALIEALDACEQRIPDLDDIVVPSRVVHLPLSWDDPATQLAIRKYMQGVRPDAPWCPSNIEFIRRINGLDSLDEVRRIVFDANYLVLGLGDVYLGAPVATPIDPRHRMVTTKYNPARTWTPENAVGIGGAYLCVYGMEGPGGYQFVGRTLQMWNTFAEGTPWLLRFFDQLRFVPVTAKELLEIREEFPRGRYPLKIEDKNFRLRDYHQFLNSIETSAAKFKRQQQEAFVAERERWAAAGQAEYMDAPDPVLPRTDGTRIPEGCRAVLAPVTASVWSIAVEAGQKVEAGERIIVLDAMKMEIAVTAPSAGRIEEVNVASGAMVSAGQRLAVLREASA